MWCKTKVQQHGWNKDADDHNENQWGDGDVPSMILRLSETARIVLLTRAAVSTMTCIMLPSRIDADDKDKANTNGF